MVAATADRQYTDFSPGLLVSLLVKAAATIYKGTAVCVDATGYAVPGADTAGLIFVGWAIEQADNSGGSSGDISVRVKTADIFPMISAGADQTWVGQTAYLSDDQTVVITGATNNIRCGSVARCNSATEVEVKAQGLFASAEIAEFAAGTAALPSVHREGDTNTGMYWPGADQVALSCGGTKILEVTATGIGVTGIITASGVIRAPAGTLGAPGFTFSGDTDTGWYNPTGDRIGIVTAGAAVLYLDATAAAFTPALDISTAGISANHVTAYKATEAKHVTIADAGDVALWVASTHPKAKVVEAWAMLTEVPDAAGTTITVRLDDGTNNITDLLTFTQGVEAVGAVKKFTVDTDYDNIAIADKIDIAVGGTSAVLGEVTVFVRFEGE